MAAYPIVLELSGRACLVVGGGSVAERKVAGLLQAGASVTVVAPRFDPGLERLAAEGVIGAWRREYRPGDVAGHDLAFVATDHDEVSATVARDGRQHRVWVNTADDPARCDFILPAVLRRGALVVAVSTGGAAPALASAVKQELERHLGADYECLSALVADVRREVRARGWRPSAGAWRRALGEDVRRLIGAGQVAEARARILRTLRSE